MRRRLRRRTSPRDLRSILIDADDIPRTHGTRFRDFTIDESQVPRSDDLRSGSPRCGEWLDREFGVEPLREVDTAFADQRPTVTVTMVVQSYEPGEAAEVMDAIRAIFRRCDSFAMDLRGTVVDVVTDLAELAETAGYEELGDDGLRVGLLVVIDDIPFRGTAYTILRVGDLIGVMGVEVPADFGRDPSPELTELMDERLHELPSGAS